MVVQAACELSNSKGTSHGTVLLLQLPHFCVHGIWLRTQLVLFAMMADFGLAHPMPGSMASDMKLICAPWRSTIRLLKKRVRLSSTMPAEPAAAAGEGGSRASATSMHACIMMSSMLGVAYILLYAAAAVASSACR
jgi:hypothetical protein